MVNIRLDDINLDLCQIRINDGKGAEDRIESMRNKEAKYLFESSWNKKYTDRGIRKIFEKYSELAELTQSLSPHKLRHFLFTWLKKQGIDDAFIQPYSGHESRKTLEVYSKLSLSDAQEKCNEVIGKFPI